MQWFLWIQNAGLYFRVVRSLLATGGGWEGLPGERVRSSPCCQHDSGNDVIMPVASRWCFGIWVNCFYCRVFAQIQECHLNVTGMMTLFPEWHQNWLGPFSFYWHFLLPATWWAVGKQGLEEGNPCIHWEGVSDITFIFSGCWEMCLHKYSYLLKNLAVNSLQHRYEWGLPFWLLL